MNRLIKTVIFILICLSGFSQDILPEEGQIYGRDPLLFNGDKYTYFVPFGTQGHQYLQGTEFTPGTVRIDGAVFNVKKINYDIFNQQVVLVYLNEAGAENIIQLSQAWLESFRIGDRSFELVALPGEAKKIYQVVGTGYLRILIYVEKTLSLDMATSAKNYVFSSPKKEYYLEKGKLYSGFHSNKSFLSVFEEDKRTGIRKYMKSHHINVKKASDRSLTDLLNYCADLEQ